MPVFIYLKGILLFAGWDPMARHQNEASDVVARRLMSALECHIELQKRGGAKHCNAYYPCLRPLCLLFGPIVDWTISDAVPLALT